MVWSRKNTKRGVTNHAVTSNKGAGCLSNAVWRNKHIRKTSDSEDMTRISRTRMAFENIGAEDRKMENSM